MNKYLRKLINHAEKLGIDCNNILQTFDWNLIITCPFCFFTIKTIDYSKTFNCPNCNTILLENEMNDLRV